MSTLYRLESDALQVEISDLGAELQSIRSRSDGAEWLWQGDPVWWAGRAPLLFPVVGRSPQDRVSIEGRSHPMGSHGFVRRSRFALLEASASRVVLELRADAVTRTAFPFDFALTVTCRLAGDALTMQVQVINADTRPMPFQFGFHPAFVWPLPGSGGQPHRIQLANGAEPDMRRPDADGLMGPAVLPSPFRAGGLTLAPGLFDAGAMVFPAGAGDRVTLSAGPAAMEMSAQNLPNFALWQKPGAPYVCLEPWHGMAPYPAQGADLAARSQAMTLAPGARDEFGMALRFRRDAG